MGQRRTGRGAARGVRGLGARGPGLPQCKSSFKTHIFASACLHGHPTVNPIYAGVGSAHGRQLADSSGRPVDCSRRRGEALRPVNYSVH